MSELTQCNFCGLTEIRRRARVQKARVYLRPSKRWGGTDIFVVPAGGKLDERTDKKGNHTSGQFVAWMLEITDRCVC